MNKKKIFLITAIIIVLVVIGILIHKTIVDNANNSSGDASLNSSDEVFLQDELPPEVFTMPEAVKIEGEKEYRGLKLTNFEVQLISARQCEVRANVRNETESLIEMQNVKLELYDAEGNLLETIGAQIDSVEPGGHTEVFAMLRRGDASDIAKIEISEN